MIVQNFFKKIKKIFAIPSLRDRIFYTLGMFLVIRTGIHIALPGVDVYKLHRLAQGGLADFINLVSGGAFSKASIFTLGIVPYINASIIIYVLTLAIPKLEEMQREGGSEKEKLTQWTRYLSIVISIAHGIGTSFYLQSQGLVEEPGLGFIINTTLLLTASVAFLTWIGDQITSNGIGNGISLIIFLGIVANIPAAVVRMFQGNITNNIIWIKAGGIGIFILSLISAVVAFQLALRKIPVFYASGRGNASASRSYLPVRINNAGVMPIIFAGVVGSFPAMLVNWIPEGWSIKPSLMMMFSYTHPVYLTLYFCLVLLFTFFYTAIIFDPEKIADNLKKSGGSIPGVRPGHETMIYLEKIITRITFGGATFLATIAVLPFVLSAILGTSFGFGGSGILIAVGVAIETVQQINGALAMEEYQSFI